LVSATQTGVIDMSALANLINADACSDLVLALVCLALAWRQWSVARGVSIALLSIALAALWGVLRYSGVMFAVGPHYFFSLLAGAAGLPLLAAALYWPRGLLARHGRAIALWLIFAGAVGILASLSSLTVWWGQAAPALALLVLGALAIRQRSVRLGGAVMLLLLAFLALVLPNLPATVSRVQVLHYLMSLGLLLLVWPQTHTYRAPVPSHQ
jgi:hypothetical protein